LIEKNNWDIITPDNLIEAGFVNKNDFVKILGNGTITAKVEVKAHAFSKSAKAAIEDAKGTVVVL
jgi:large subunit ribosomal protein L15